MRDRASGVASQAAVNLRRGPDLRRSNGVMGYQALDRRKAGYCCWSAGGGATRGKGGSCGGGGGGGGGGAVGGVWMSRNSTPSLARPWVMPVDRPPSWVTTRWASGGSGRPCASAFWASCSDWRISLIRGVPFIRGSLARCSRSLMFCRRLSVRAVALLTLPSLANDLLSRMWISSGPVVL